MKYTLIIDKGCEPEVVIRAGEKTEEVMRIIAACEESSMLFGYDGQSALRLDVDEVYAFVSEGDRVYALLAEGRIAVKERLYILLSRYSSSFVKINQSCLGNISKIERFSVSFGGSLVVKFKNGYSDYVSRREIKRVKERIGVKL